MRRILDGTTVRRWLALAAAVLLGSMVPPAASAAEPFRVGPGGTHATIQGALNDAVVGSAARDIHVAAGYWPERIRLDLFEEEVPRVRLFGGWNAGFTERTEDPSATVLDGGGAGSVIELDANTDGHLYVSGFTITGGRTDAAGGGVLAYLRGRMQLTLEGNHIVGNRAGGPAATAGGLGVFLWDDTAFWLLDNRVEGNVAESPGAANTGGAHIGVGDSAYAQLIGNQIVGNEARSTTNGAFHAGTASVAFAAERYAPICTCPTEPICATLAAALSSMSFSSA